MADPSAPPACYSCQNFDRGCPMCNRPGRPVFPGSRPPPPYNPPNNNPPHYPPPPHHPPHHPPQYPPHHPPQHPHHQPPYQPPPRQPGFCPPPVNPPHVPRPPVRPQPPGGRPPNTPAYYWVDTMARGGVPSTALRGGTDIDGHEIYVGRAFHEGDWLPAKIVPGRGQAYVAYNGLEHCVENFQVLCEQRFDWVPASGGHIPPGAVEGGKTVDGESLYIGRAHHDGSLTIGKIHPSHGTCYIPFGGREIGYSDYEILVLRS